MDHKNEPSKQTELQAGHILPFDILFDILSRLPVQSLLRFRSVCKSWCKFISDPQFISSHLKQAKRHPSIIVFPCKPDGPKLKIEFHSYVKGCNMPSLLLERELYSEHKLHVHPSHCDGLIMLCSVTDIYVCNPSMREFVTLPKGSPGKSGNKHIQLVGMGLDSSTNKYKVVRLFYRSVNVKTGDYSLGCEIYTLGTQSWRAISDPPCMVTSNFPACVNEVMYWYTFDCSKDEPDHILSLDLREEKFGLIPTPPFGVSSVRKDCSTYVREFGGRLYVPDMPPDSPVLDMWVLKNETEHKWVKEYSIGLETPWQMKPVAIHDEDVLLTTCQRLVCYNPGSKKFQAVLSIRKRKNPRGRFLNGAVGFYSLVCGKFGLNWSCRQLGMSSRLLIGAATEIERQ